MRVKIMAALVDDEGREVSTPIEVETGVPEPEEVRGAERFVKGFHRFEQSVLGVRNEVGEKLAEQYLAEVGARDKKTKEAPESTQ